jgi:predicted DNA-binding transcriptional regulator AlpA
MRLATKNQPRKPLQSAGDSRLLRTAGIAQLLGMSEQAVRNALYRGEEGKTIPPSIKLGKRRVWLRREVVRWLNGLGRSRPG